jgi:hypothetical protein
LGGELPKTELAGSLHVQLKRCGKPRCRCRAGHLHGPYAYLHWREEGRQRKRYIPALEVPAVAAAIARRRARRVWSMRVLLATLSRLASEEAP